jgi:acetyl-CoA synthetase
MTYHVSLDYESYEAAREGFEWNVPESYNAAHDLVGKHEDPKARVGLFQAYPDGRRETYTFHDLDALSNRVANGLAGLGVERGDRVGVVVPQKPATVLTHLACWKLGAVSLPLSVLFGPDALEYRLRDSGAAAVVVDESVRETLEAVRGDLPDLGHVVEVDGDAAGDALAFADLHASESRRFEYAETDGDTPMVVPYTSGSTGPPKGVVLSHDVWIGHCPAYRMYFERDLDGSVMWTPADWAWLGGLGNLLSPAWHYGRPVVGYPTGSFDAETAFSILEEFGVTHAWIPPTAIRMLMSVEDPGERFDLDLEVIAAGGEPLTPEIPEWADETLGVLVNEQYGQTEANLIATTCQGWFEARPGSMGKPTPGFDVAILDTETREELGPGELGEIAVKRDDNPVVFERYWNQPERTAEVRVDVPGGDASGTPGTPDPSGEWHVTGDLAVRDEDGYYWFKSRDDDVIITAGYRVGPGEVESAVLEHPDVEQVGVIGVPEETRGEIIKAFVQPVAGVAGDDALRERIRDLVRENLAEYEYPREIEFVEALPTTTTGKIRRKALRERERGGDRDGRDA